jgi:hypothetical protein
MQVLPLPLPLHLLLISMKPFCTTDGRGLDQPSRTLFRLCAKLVRIF